MKYTLLIVFITFLFTACEKEELPLPAPIANQGGTPIDTTGGENLIVKGALVTNGVTMESDYRNQIWFDLGTNSIVKTNLRTDWDLAFDCNLNDNILYLNAALNASVAFTNEIDFMLVNSDAGLTYVYEHQSGRSGKLAIGDVSNQRNVFIIDRGFNPKGKALGKWKAQITLVQDGDYYLTCSKLNGDDLTTSILSKKPQYNKIAYSFNTLTELQIEPAKTDYDICFTQYTHVFENPPIPYSVNGAIINSYNTEVAEEFNLDFNAITRSHAEGLFYSYDLDIIGYDWKNFSLQDNIFTVYSNKNYLIKDASGNLFKLHFLDFYDENGVKGTPSFEFLRL
ncbi:MAG: HmuY family protein [Flavobacteriales bacterium]|nr:HmuY family protein [Flavobacteriales bacterium]